MRRVLAVVVGAGIAAGGGAAAWAQTTGPDGTKREAARACLSQAREAAPDAGKPALREAVNRLTEDESPAAVASAVEFVLEGLHLSKRLNKEAAGARATYRSRG